MRKILIFLFIYCWAMGASNAQFRRSPQHSIGIDYSGGFILKHKEDIAHLITHHPQGIRITYNRKTFGNKAWQQRFNYPDIGLTFIYLDYKNDIIGKSFALIPHYQVYLTKNKDAKNQFAYKIGMGIEYNTEKYEKENNNKNNLLSTDFNASVILETSYKRILSPRTSLQSSVSLTHFSNGSLKRPNSGINIVTANVGVNYLFKYKPASYISIEEKPIEKNIGFSAGISSGFHAYSRRGTGQHPFIILTSTIDKRLNHKSAIGLSLEYFASWSMKKDITYDWEIRTAGGSLPGWTRLGVAVGHELFVSNLSIITQAGYYIRDEYDYFGKLYLRLGLRRYINKHFYVSMSVKSHAARAEALEFAGGYRFK